MSDRLITAKELAVLVPFCRMHFHRLEKAGVFPRRIKIGERRVAWRLSEVTAWIEGRASDREPSGTPSDPGDEDTSDDPRTRR